jgi:hypothetical protein
MKNMILHQLVVIVLFVVGCGHDIKSDNKEFTADSLGRIEQKNETKIGYMGLVLKGSLTKGRKKASEECEKWSFDEASLDNLLSKMRKVSAREAYVLCSQYGCWYEGIVVNDSVSFEIAIYAGATVTLSNDKEVLHFVLEEESSLFLDACDCCENE